MMTEEEAPPPEAPSEPPEKNQNEETNDEKDEKKAENDPLATIGEVFSFARTSTVKWYIVIGFFFAAISGAVFPTMAFLFARVFEDLSADVGSNKFMDNLRTMAFYFMILGVVAFTTMTAQAMLLEMAATEMSNLLKMEWFEALLRQDMAYYDIRDVSGTATIIATNGAKFKKGTGKKLADFIQFGITFVGGLAYGFWSSWQTSLTILIVVPFMVASTAFLLKMNTTQTARANSSYANAGSIVYMTVSSIRTILSLNAVESMIEKFTKATQEAYESAVSQVMLFGLANGSVMASFLLGYIPVVLYGSFLLYDNVRDSGCDPSGAIPDNDKCDPAAIGVFGALFGITFAGAVLPQVSSSVEAFTGARSAAYPALVAMNRKSSTEEDGQVDPELEEKSQALQRRGSTAPLPTYVIDSSSPLGLKPDKVEGNIEFKGVHFAYPTRQEIQVYNDFSLNIEAGKTVALVGPSGGGKSTAVQLIERFYDPMSGSITLDGHDLKSLNVKWLREHIGLVSQEPKLFALSIKDNIAIGNPNATMEQIEEAARKANAHDFIMSFPKGYDTQVGDQGSQLSGGQRQRIAIARVLIKKPKIILLDEATSALDSESEVVVQEALDVLMGEGNQTIIVIAHRLSTIKNADMIAVVKDGKVVETGNHAELISTKGHYFDLVEAQKGVKKNERRESSVSSPSRSSSFSGEQSGGEEGEADAQDALDDKTQNETVVKFEHVHFHYPSRPDNHVFHGLNLSIHEGETVAIVGPSGQGKSTIIQLIENFYRPSKGSIYFRGVDMKELNVKWLRDQLSLVSQEPVLFDNSILENIKFGCDATQEEVEQAAKQANAHDFITAFPDGYDTQVGAGSTQISGGQKQRIAIARALLRKPKVLLLDEATSALDSASEKIVQDALDKIMADKTQTTIVIAHRLSTIRDADRIAVIDHGKVREIGSHDELMAKENGRYRHLQELQSLEGSAKRSHGDDEKEEEEAPVVSKGETHTLSKEEAEKDKALLKANASRARMMAEGDAKYFFIGSIGAIFAGLMFPGWGFIFAYMIELLYYPVVYCDGVDFLAPEPFGADCQAYWDDAADYMANLSLDIFYGLLAILCTTLLGNALLYYGFGTATERMNKRVRDAVFRNLVRQEISWFDVRPVGSITSQLSDDAALIHSFVGEPIRTLVLNLASVFVGLVVSFYYMWPFALLTLGILPFMAFGAEAEMNMYMGEDEADLDAYEEHSSGGIVVESLLNIRTVASLTIEKERLKEFKEALRHENPHPFRSNFVKGSTSGLGQFVQMWGISLMFWWGGWLMFNYPNKYEFRAYLISMFSLLFALSGMGMAMQGATDREKAKAAAERVFELIDRKSEIDPLSKEGKKLD